MHLKGVLTALVTPFDKDQLDEKTLKSHIQFQIESGVDGLVVLGTTGEGATLTAAESARIVALVAQEVKKRIPVIVHVGDSATARAVSKAKQAEELGADALLVITPYYNRPTQQGLIAHFEAIADQTSCPLIVYHHPKRTGAFLSRETLTYLAQIDSIVGIKDGAGDVRFATQTLYDLPDDFLFFSGDDLMTLPLVSLGACGVISVASNLLPGQMKHFVDAALENDWQLARLWQRKLFPFFQALTLETNPIPIKAMLAFSGRGTKMCRLPLTFLAREHEDQIKNLVQNELPIEVAHG